MLSLGHYKHNYNALLFYQGKHSTNLSRTNLQANSDCFQRSSMSLTPRSLCLPVIFACDIFRKSFVMHLLNMIYRMSLGLANLLERLRSPQKKKDSVWCMHHLLFRGKGCSVFSSGLVLIET